MCSPMKKANGQLQMMWSVDKQTSKDLKPSFHLNSLINLTIYSAESKDKLALDEIFIKCINVQPNEKSKWPTANDVVG